MDELDRLLQGISVYQDVVVDGRTVRRGVRDCEARWQAIAPHLPSTGTLADIGANFAWFSLRWCAEGAERTAAAWEADRRSAGVARFALASHPHHRVCLVTAPASAAGVQTFAAAGQRFAASVCLSVLHWIPDHRAFLKALGGITDRLFVEHCDPREAGAGVERLRREIGEIGPYLRELFPDRPVERLAVWEAHRSQEYPRELWIVREPANSPASHEPALPGLAVGAALELDVAWPPRSWWREQLAEVFQEVPGRLWLTSHGVHCEPIDPEADLPAEADDVKRLLRRIAGIPERGVSTWRRRLRRAAASAMRRWSGRR